MGNKSRKDSNNKARASGRKTVIGRDF